MTRPADQPPGWALIIPGPHDPRGRFAYVAADRRFLCLLWWAF
jgi:hypothetical protein